MRGGERVQAERSWVLVTERRCSKLGCVVAAAGGDERQRRAGRRHTRGGSALPTQAGGELVAECGEERESGGESREIES